MSEQKKEIRRRFRAAVFARDRYCCAVCGFRSSPERVEEELDAHHITNRNELPNGGYVPENGISLCGECHLKAEQYHLGLPISAGFWPNDLYARIRSNRDRAELASIKLTYNPKSELNEDK